MNVQLQDQFNGHKSLVAVLENGRTVARFDDESEAIEWCRVEYGDDIAEGVEYDR